MTSFDEMTVEQFAWYVAKRGISAVLALIVLFGSWVIVRPGEQGIKVTLGKVHEGTLAPGLHFKMPIVTKVHRISTQTQAENDKLPAASSDLQDVEIEVVVNWHVNPNSVADIQIQYRGLENYTKSVIGPMIRDAVKATSARYTAEELIKKRDSFASQIGTVLSESMAVKGAVSERVSIVNFTFSPSFTKAIEAKVVAEQDALASKNKLAQTEYEAQQRIAQAKGEAEAIKIQASAITQQGGADYVKLQWISRWNGALPTTMLGENTPLVNIK